MAVQVDEPGRDDLAGGVDAAADVRRARVVAAGEQAEPLPVDDDAPRPPGRAGPVDDRPAADQQVRAVRHATGARALQAAAAHPGARGPCPGGPGRSAGSSGRRGRRPSTPGDRRHERRVDRDEVGLLARPRASRSRSSSPSARAPPSVPRRSQSSGVRAGPLARPATSQRVLRVGADAHRREDREVRAAGHVRSEPDRPARPPGSARAA